MSFVLLALGMKDGFITAGSVGSRRVVGCQAGHVCICYSLSKYLLSLFRMDHHELQRGRSRGQRRDDDDDDDDDGEKTKPERKDY